MNIATDESRLIRVMTALVCDPWMITPEMHRTLTDIVKAHAAGGQSEREQHERAAGFAQNQQEKGRSFALVGNVAVIGCEGVIGRKFSDCLQSSGVVSIDVWQRMLNVATDDDKVEAILLVFDSPGGAVTGVPEAAAAVARASSRKPVIAFADGQMCSAAYYIASQASQIYAMPSAQVGSIGVYLSILDQSRAAEMQGIKVELFKSGKHKGMGQPGTSLNDEQRTMLQARVDKLGADFRTTVRDGRKVVIADSVMQGQSFDASEALTNGLIDGVTDFDGALGNASHYGTMAKLKKGQ